MTKGYSFLLLVVAWLLLAACVVLSHAPAAEATDAATDTDAVGHYNPHLMTCTRVEQRGDWRHKASTRTDVFRCTASDVCFYLLTSNYTGVSSIPCGAGMETPIVLPPLPTGAP